MIILDTNVLSEIAKPGAAPQVLAWFDRQPRLDLFLTALTQAEILYGIAALPPGKRKSGLEQAARTTFEQDFEGRILPFDLDAAQEYASIAVARRRSGRPISVIDAQIAAIARSRGAALATRNTSDFQDCGITVIDPWTQR